MNKERKHPYFWDRITSIDEAKKYETRSNFKKYSPSAYQFCCKHNIMNDACAHMKPQGSRYLRFIYVFEFYGNDINQNKSVYVGLTHNIKERYWSHINRDNSTVYKYIQLTNANFEFKVITEQPIPNEDAQILEHETIQKYKENGWNILNKSKTGKGSSSLGGNIKKWTKEECLKEALLYQSRKTFDRANTSAYQAVLKNNWSDEAFVHMPEGIKPKRYWYDKDICFEEASKYKSLTELKRNSPSAYQAAYINNWLSEFYPDKKIQKPYGYWDSKEHCLEAALTCSSRLEFSKKFSKAYNTSREQGWIDEVCAGMEEKTSKYTKEECKKIALQYNTRGDFRKYNQYVYNICRVNSWLNEVCSQMPEIVKPTGYWTKEKCLEQSLLYMTRNDFKKGSSSAYTSAVKCHFLDEICSHMTEIIKPKNYWNDKDNCKTESQKYNTKQEFRVNCPGGHKSSYLHGWLDEFYPKQQKTSPN
jgi:predicted GIY-YIG superfamily endonuclease